jgi:hypothetical protein
VEEEEEAGGIRETAAFRTDHSELAIGSAHIGGGGVLANPEDGIVAPRSAVRPSFPIHQTKPESAKAKYLWRTTQEEQEHPFKP